MLLLMVLTAVAVVVAVEAVAVPFLFWQFEASLALVILAGATAGLLRGVLVRWAHARGRCRARSARPAPKSLGAPTGR